MKRHSYVFRASSRLRGFADLPVMVLTVLPGWGDVAEGSEPMRKLLRELRDAIAGTARVGVSLTRANPRTLVHAGMAQAALFHVLSGRGAPLADLYVGRDWARKVGRVLASFYGEPVQLVEHANWPYSGREVQHEATELVAANPGAPWPPLVGEDWRNTATGEVATVRTVKGQRAEVMSHRSGLRIWLDRLDMQASWKPQRRGNPRGLSEDERALLTHISMWGSKGYPVRKLGRGWTWDYRGIKGPPVVFKRKRDVVASFEAFMDVLRAASGELAQERALAARATRGNPRAPRLPRSHQLTAKLVGSLGFQAMARDIRTGTHSAPETLRALLNMRGVPESRKVLLRVALQALEREAAGMKFVSSKSELESVKREAFGRLSRELGRPVRVPNPLSWWARHKAAINRALKARGEKRITPAEWHWALGVTGGHPEDLAYRIAKARAGGQSPPAAGNPGPQLTGKTATLRKGWGYWDTTHYPYGGKFARATRDELVTVVRSWPNGHEHEIRLPDGRTGVAPTGALVADNPSGRRSGGWGIVWKEHDPDSGLFVQLNEAPDFGLWLDYGVIDDPDAGGLFSAQNQRAARAFADAWMRGEPLGKCLAAGRMHGQIPHSKRAQNPGARFVFGQPVPTSGVSAAIRPGDRVTYVDRFGVEHTGRAVMPSSHGGWVLNMGGPHGTPAVVDNSNIVRVKSSKRNPPRVVSHRRALTMLKQLEAHERHGIRSERNPAVRVSGTLEVEPAPEPAPPAPAESPEPAPEPAPELAPPAPAESPEPLEPEGRFHSGEVVTVPYSGRPSYFGRRVRRTRERATVVAYARRDGEPVVHVRVKRGRGWEDHEFPERDVRRRPRPRRLVARERLEKLRAKLEPVVGGSFEKLRDMLGAARAALESATQLAQGLIPDYREAPSREYLNARAALRRAADKLEAMRSIAYSIDPERARELPGIANPLPRWAEPRSIRTVPSGRSLVRVACPRGHYRPRARGPRKCAVGTRAVETLTPRRNPAVCPKAARTFRMWHEFGPSSVKRVRVPSRVIPSQVVRLGEITRIDYKSDKWNKGRMVTYTHQTRAPRPILVTDPGARQTYIVGGRMRVTRDGLVH